MSDSIYALGVTRNLEKRIVLFIVNLQLSEFIQFGNLAIRRMESQPKLTTSYSPDNSNKQKSVMWRLVGKLEKLD